MVIRTVADHVLQLLDAVVGQCCDGFVGAVIDADDVALGQIVVVRDDRFKKRDVLAQLSGYVVDSTYMGHRSHQAASEWAAFSGTQFHGNNSSNRLILCSWMRSRMSAR